jgi:hypothetical protein
VAIQVLNSRYVQSLDFVRQKEMVAIHRTTLFFVSILILSCFWVPIYLMLIRYWFLGFVHVS